MSAEGHVPELFYAGYATVCRVRYRMPGTLPASPKEVAFELLRPVIAELRPGLGTPWRWKVGSSH